MRAHPGGRTRAQRRDALILKVAAGQNGACHVWSSVGPKECVLSCVDKGQDGRRVLGSSGKGQLLQKEIILLTSLGL